MHLEARPSADAAQWDTLVRQLGGNVFHSTPWARYIVRGRPNAKPRFFTLRDPEGQVVAAALGFLERSSRPLVSRLGGRLWFDAVPLASEGYLKEFLVALATEGRRLKAVEIDIGSYAYRDGETDLAGAGYEPSRRYEFVVDLQRTDAELKRSFRRGRRSDINRARRNGVVIRHLDARAGLRELRRLEIPKHERIRARGGPEFRARPSDEDDPAAVLLEAGVARLVGAELDGELLSVSLFTIFNGIVYYTLLGQTGRAFEVEAPSLLMWEVFREFRDEGASEFNMGGCAIDADRPGSPEHGVYSYKSGFGPRRVTCVGGRRVIRPLAYRLRRVLGRTSRS